MITHVYVVFCMHVCVPTVPRYNACTPIDADLFVGVAAASV